jgi:hypothetical protein
MNALKLIDLSLNHPALNRHEFSADHQQAVLALLIYPHDENL